MHLNEALYLQIPLQLKATGGQTRRCVCLCRRLPDVRLGSVDEHVRARIPGGGPALLNDWLERLMTAG